MVRFGRWVARLVGLAWGSRVVVPKPESRVPLPIWPSWVWQRPGEMVVGWPAMVDDGLPADGIVVGPVNLYAGWWSDRPMEASAYAVPVDRDPGVAIARAEEERLELERLVEAHRIEIVEHGPAAGWPVNVKLREPVSIRSGYAILRERG